MNAHSFPIRAYVLTDDEREERAREERWEELRRDIEENEFREWQREGIRGLRECENNPRDDEDFDSWLLQQARRSGGHYADALDWKQRSLIEMDRIASGHRQFVRGRFA